MKWERFLRSEWAWALWVSLVFALLGIPGVLPTAWWAFQNRAYATDLAILVFVTACIVSVYVIRPRPVPDKLQDTTTFIPFPSETSQLNPFERPEEVKAIADAVEQGNGRVLVVTGPSGAGKTTILARLLEPEEGQHLPRPYLVPDCSMWSQIPSPEKVGHRQVVILDQFERLFCEETDWARTASVEGHVLENVQRLLDAHKVVVLGIREDRYYLLRFFRELLPPLDQSVRIDRVSKERDPRVFDELIEDMRQYLNGSVPSFDSQGHTLLELQAFGAYAELLSKSGQSTHDVLAMDPATAMTNLVRLFAAHAPIESTCLRVLYAINRAPSGKNLSVRELIWVLGEPRDRKDVADACCYLEAKGLIRQHGDSSSFEISHDALAIPVDVATMAALPPIARDPIDTSLKVMTLERVDADEKRMIMWGNIAWHVMGAISVAVLARLLVPWQGWYVLPGITSATHGLGPVDALYLAIAVPHFLWCSYVASHDVHVYRERDRSIGERVVSIAIVLNLLVCIGIGIFFPAFWIVAIGWGGLGQAIKTISMQRHSDLSLVAKSALRARAWITIANMALTMAIGVGVGMIILEGHVGSTPGIITLTYVGSMVYVYAWIVLYRAHVTNDQAAYLRGLLRPGYAS